MLNWKSLEEFFMGKFILQIMGCPHKLLFREEFIILLSHGKDLEKFSSYLETSSSYIERVHILRSLSMSNSLKTIHYHLNMPSNI